jgi:hypothetical protein
MQTRTSESQSHYENVAEKLIALLTTEEKKIILDQVAGVTISQAVLQKFSGHYHRVYELIFKREDNNVFSKILIAAIKNWKSLENMDRDIGNKEVAKRLELKDLMNLGLVSKSTSALFQPTLEQRQAIILAKTVDLADYTLTNTIVSTNPRLMFECIHYSGMVISPLQLAFRNFDYKMWTLFLSEVENNKEDLKKFINQYDLQKTKIDLNPLFDAYITFMQQYKLWETGYLTNGEINKALVIFGQQQLATLPAHMLKSFCCEFGWYPEYARKFLMGADPTPAEVSRIMGRKSDDVSINLLDPKIEKDFALVSWECRGNSVLLGHRDAGIVRDIPRFARMCLSNEERDGIGGALRALKRDFDTFDSLWEGLNELLTEAITLLKESIFNEEHPKSSTKVIGLECRAKN